MATCLQRYKISLWLLKNTSLINAVLTCEIFFNINGEISNLQRPCNFFLLHKILSIHNNVLGDFPDDIQPLSNDSSKVICRLNGCFQTISNELRRLPKRSFGHTCTPTNLSKSLRTNIISNMISHMYIKMTSSHWDIVFINLLPCSIPLPVSAIFTISDVWTSSMLKQPVNTFCSTILCSLEIIQIKHVLSYTVG